jgi:hypothetical protein
MTPTETAAILRQLHDWLRGGTQWAPTMGAEAVKTAIEMIERMERIESAAQNLVKMKGRHNTEIAYQRLVSALEEPKCPPTK